MRIMSFAKTWPQFLNTDPKGGATKIVTRRMKQIWIDRDGTRWTSRPAFSRAGDFRKLWVPAWIREGEPVLKPNEVFEGVEWPPRVGPRWCCALCSYVGSKALRVYRVSTDWPPGRKDELERAGHFPREGWNCPECKRGWLSSRLPVRGILARHVRTTNIALGQPDWTMEQGQAEAALEGFPDMCFDAFLDLCFPGVPLHAEVARIEFERIERTG